MRVLRILLLPPLCLALALTFGCAASDPASAEADASPAPAAAQKVQAKRAARDDLRVKAAAPKAQTVRAEAPAPKAAPEPEAETLSISFSAEEEAAFARQADANRAELRELEAEMAARRNQQQAAQAGQGLQASDGAQATPQNLQSVLQQTFLLAKSQNKMVMMDFYADWCGPCKKLSSETFADPRVKSWMDQNVIFVKVNTDYQQAFAQANRVEALPTVVCYNSDGAEVNRFRGFMPADTFLQWSAQTAGMVR